jgi:phenylpyruvate tautomerase PptA (4-oxalocrotonate tautomerase family)
MPHLVLHAPEHQLTGNEALLITALTEAVVGIYGEWARPLVAVRLDGVPRGRWAIGGAVVNATAPEVTFGVRASALARADGPEIARRLVAGITDAVAGVLGDEFREITMVELVPQHDDRVGVGGRLISETDAS